MAPTHGRFRALYGGRHLRTTLVLATTSLAAGTLTGLVGIGVAGTPASRSTPAPAHHAKPVKPRHHTASTVPAYTVTKVRPTRSRSASPSPTATRTAAATPTTNSTPSSAPTTAGPTTSPSSQPTSGTTPGPQSPPA